MPKTEHYQWYVEQFSDTEQHHHAIEELYFSGKTPFQSVAVLRTAAFGKMPIVIVAYSGGFGPTLSVLDRGGVKSRVRGLVLLDALYAGIDKFADWIADNRSTFFVSSYTPHTAHHNAELERLLSERSVPYSSELRRGRLQGMVTFLPAGDVSHRDFVNHAWADNPIKDILARMDDVDPKIETAGTTASIPSGAAATKRN